ncbi:unnamed protein product [Didymodactylos carnosus]|uniref:Uncharacterized protein n=1 Tax=Didymodactylos carnosus TaxID=1234261 RepID=A0A8S2JB86_9BILA|nr:unnamed protein product [Didymodactylos carnosus]CAF3790325.1 unnamed protein product [Didymodactylos carnosus]
MNLYTSTWTTTTTEQMHTNLERENGSFMWFQIVIEVLLRSRSPEQYEKEVGELIARAKQQYKNNPTQLALIDQYHNKGYPGKPKIAAVLHELESTITWYTRECFLYRMLNKALRKQDIDMLYAFGFFIRRLHKELKKEQGEQIQKLKITTQSEPTLNRESTNHEKATSDILRGGSADSNSVEVKPNVEEKSNETVAEGPEPTVASIIHVYRGRGISNEELTKLKEGIGKTISINSFFSTTRNVTVALGFTQLVEKTADKQLVLFEVEADLCLQGAKPFADISHLSDNKSEEVLFMLGSLFRIVDVNKEDHLSDIWTVKLILCSDEDDRLKDVLERFKRQLPKKTNLYDLGNVLFEMGAYEHAQKCYTRHMCTAEDPLKEVTSVLCIKLGEIARIQKKYDFALKCLKKVSWCGPFKRWIRVC